MNRLKVTRIIAIVAFVIYLFTMILPYKSYREPNSYYNGAVTTYYPSSFGADSEYIIFFILFIPALVFFLVRHTMTMKILVFITCTLLFSLSILLLYEDFSPDYSKPNIGFYLFLFSSLFLFISSIIKLPIPVPKRKNKSTELLDDF